MTRQALIRQIDKTAASLACQQEQLKHHQEALLQWVKPSWVACLLLVPAFCIGWSTARKGRRAIRLIDWIKFSVWLTTKAR